MTTTAANKALVRRRYGGLIAKGDTAVAEEVLAEDYLDHDLLGVGQGGRQEQVGRACGPPGRRPAWTACACAPSGGGLTGPNPTDRGKPASTYHLLVDRRGSPLAACLSAANTHDAMLLEQVMDAVAPVKGPRGRPGRPRKRPAKPHLDKGYHDPRYRRPLRRRGSTPRMARRGIQSSQRPGRDRYVAERSLAWLVSYRRLQVRYQRRADILLELLSLAGALVCCTQLPQPKG